MDALFSGAHFHLLVNHLPIVGSMFALALLIASYFVAGDVLRRTAFAVLIATGLAAAAANYSGEPAEDAIKGYPGVRRELIHDHEEAGEKAFIAAALVGVLALGALVRWRHAPVPRGVSMGMLVSTAIVGGLMAYTGLLGGRVRHTEVRPGATAGDATIVEPPRASRERESESER